MRSFYIKAFTEKGNIFQDILRNNVIIDINDSENLDAIGYKKQKDYVIYFWARFRRQIFAAVIRRTNMP